MTPGGGLKVGEIYAEVGARLQEAGFKRWRKEVTDSKTTAAKPINASLGGKVDQRGFASFRDQVAAARLERADATLGATLKPGGFAEFRRELEKARQARAEATLGAKVDDSGFKEHAKRVADADRKKIETELGGRLDRRQFAAYRREQDRAEARAKRRGAFETVLGARFNGQAFDAFERSADRSDRAQRRLNLRLVEGSRGMNLFAVRTRIPIVALGGFAAAAYAAAPPVIGLTSAVGSLVNALAAAPGLLSALIQGVGAGFLGLKGIGDATSEAWDAQASAATDAADTASKQTDAIEAAADAEDGLEDAQRDRRRAQDALTEAQDASKRSLEDLDMASKRSALEQFAANQRLAAARRELLDVLADPNADAAAVREARFAVRDARFAVREAAVERRRTNQDLRKAQAGGPRNMPEVVAARERLADANRAVARQERDVERASRKAGEAMVDAGAGATALQEKMDQLSPAGQQFVRFLEGEMFPRVKQLRETAQEGLLPGLEEGIRRALPAFPIVDKAIGKTSRTLGELATEAGTMVGSKGWLADLETQAGRNDVVVDRLGGTTLHLADTLRHLMIEAWPVLNWITKSTEAWSANVEAEAEAGRESGRLGDYMEKVRRRLEVVVDIAGNLAGTFWNIGKASSDSGEESLRSFRKMTQGWQDWTGSLKGQNAMRDWFEDAQDARKDFYREIRQIRDRFRELRREGKPTGEALTIALTEAFNRNFPKFVKAVAERAPRIAGAFVEGFLTANIWGKLLIGGWLISKLGGRAAIAAVGSRVGGRVADNIADSLIATFGRRRRGIRGSGVGLGRALGRGLTIGLLLALPVMFDDAAKWLRENIGELPLIKQSRELGEAIGAEIRKGIKSGIGGILDGLGGLPGQGLGLLGAGAGLLGGGREGGHVTPGGIQRFALGGPVLPPGEDTWAALRFGEFVQRREAVQREGVPAMRALNEGAATIVPTGVTGPGLAETLAAERKRAAGPLQAIGEDLGLLAGAAREAGKAAAKGIVDPLEEGGTEAVDGAKKMRKGFAGEIGDLERDTSRITETMVDRQLDRLDSLRKGADRAASRLRRVVGDRFEGTSRTVDRETRRMQERTERRFDSLARSGGRGAGRFETSVKSSMGATSGAVYKGMSYIGDTTAEALKAFDAKPIKLDVVKPKALAGGGRVEEFANGGWIGGRDKVGRDSVALDAPIGGSVWNRHQTPWLDMALGAAGHGGIDGLLASKASTAAGRTTKVRAAPGELLLGPRETSTADRALRETGFGGLDAIFSAITTPHFMATGGIVPIPGFPGESIHRSILPDVLALAKRYKINITDGYATSGHAAAGEHPKGLAIDAIPGPGGSWDMVDRLARWAEPVQDQPRFPFRWVGYDGDANHGRGHHIHLSWLAGEHIRGFEDMQIPKLRVKGTKGGARDVAQGSLDRTRKAGNRYIDQQMQMPVGPHGDGPVPPGQVKRWLTEALKATGHYSPENLRLLYGRTMQESGGNPRAINLWDSNAAAGHPSKGLLQTIDSTFDTHKLKGHGNIWDPVDNAIAAIRYMFAEYGHIVGPSGSGYATGGIIGAGDRITTAIAGAIAGGDGPSIGDYIPGFAGGGRIEEPYPPISDRPPARRKGQKVKLRGPRKLGLRRFGKEVDRRLAKQKVKIAPIEAAIESLTDQYGRAERRYDLDEETFIFEPDDRGYDPEKAAASGNAGGAYLDEGMLRKRLGELDGLLEIRAQLVAQWDTYIRAVHEIRRQLTAALARLKVYIAQIRERVMALHDRVQKLKNRAEDLRGRLRRARDPKVRGRLRDQLAAVTEDLKVANRGERTNRDELEAARKQQSKDKGLLERWGDKLPELVGGREDAWLDFEELRRERNDLEPGARFDLGQALGDAQSPEDLAKAAYEQFQNFQAARAELFQGFGGNFVAPSRLSMAFTDASQQAAGFRFFGAFDGAAGAGGGRPDLNVTQNIHFNGGPSSERLFPHVAAHEVSAAMGVG